MEKKLKKSTFGKRIGSMMTVDARRMLLTPMFYIMLGAAIIVPILIFVMTGMMDGSPITDAQTGLPVLDAEGNPAVMEGFDNVWQIIGTVSSTADAEAGAAAMSMDLVSMCNINLLYFGIAVLVCIFVSADFKSGYAKNLFTVRAGRTDYVISKTVICSLAAAILVIGFLIGAMIGGAISSLSFSTVGFGISGLVMCILSKIFLMTAFAAMYVMASVIGKQRTWLGMIISFAVSMLLFSMIPMITPLDATIVNVVLTLTGGVLLCLGLGAISRLVLKKRDIL